MKKNIILIIVLILLASWGTKLQIELVVKDQRIAILEQETQNVQEDLLKLQLGLEERDQRITKLEQETQNLDAIVAELSDKERYYSLTVDINPHGSGSVSHASQRYKYGATATLVASPNSGWVFDHWEGDVMGMNSSASITMHSDKMIVACFVKAPLSVMLQDMIVKLEDLPSGWHQISYTSEGEGEREFEIRTVRSVYRNKEYPTEWENIVFSNDVTLYQGKEHAVHHYERIDESKAEEISLGDTTALYLVNWTEQWAEYRCIYQSNISFVKDALLIHLSCHGRPLCYMTEEDIFEFIYNLAQVVETRITTILEDM